MDVRETDLPGIGKNFRLKQAAVIKLSLLFTMTVAGKCTTSSMMIPIKASR